MQQKRDFAVVAAILTSPQYEEPASSSSSSSSTVVAPPAMNTRPSKKQKVPEIMTQVAHPLVEDVNDSDEEEEADDEGVDEFNLNDVDGPVVECDDDMLPQFTQANDQRYYKAGPKKELLLHQSCIMICTIVTQAHLSHRRMNL